MLVIKGAYYFDRVNGTILVPHFTGDFWIVDCDLYVKMERLQEMYDDGYIDDARNYSIEFEGKKYYPAGHSAYSVDKNWELLSDLSKLEHFEEDYDF